MARELNMALAKIAQDKTYVKTTDNVERARAYSANVARKRKRNNAIVTTLMAACVISAYLYIVLDAFNLPSMLVRMLAM